MTNVIRSSMVSNYLKALEQDEAEIEAASTEYETARARLEVALRRYVALRDFVTEQLGSSPYEQGVQWPSDLQGDVDGDQRVESPRGHFRFAGMKPGDAVVEILRERRNNPVIDYDSWNNEQRNYDMSLAEIVRALSEGGLGFPEPVTARSVNAALMKTAGVARNHDGTYVYGYKPNSDEDIAPRRENTEVEVDDLPIE